MGHWFYDNKTHEQQIDYCQNLKGGKKSKFCDIRTKMPIPRTGNDIVKTTPAPPSSGDKKTHDYYDVEGEYTWAKKSAISNMGADIDGSARHKRNKGRDWGSLSDMADNKDFKKKDLVQQFSINIENIKNGHEASYWVIHEVMKKYPDEYGIDSKEDREKWINKYKEYLEHGYSIAENEQNPILVGSKFIAYLKSQAIPAGRGGVNYAIYAFCYNGMHDSFSNKNGFFEKLKLAYGISSGIRRDQSCLDISSAHQKEPNSEKFKLILSGKPFQSTMTGEKSVVERFDEGAVYRKIPLERLGLNHFNSVAESEDYLINQVKLKGIQFGNSLSDNEKAEHMGHASHSFFDMAKALDIKPELISLNGSLSLGFGSRGVAGSMATFFPDHDFMNINRNNGYGALAHEWSHGLGYFLGSKALKDYDHRGSGRACISNIRSVYLNNSPELKELKKEIDNVSVETVRRIRSDPNFRTLPKGFANWAIKPQELFARAFEHYIYKKMKDKGLKNSYLVNHVDHFVWPTEEETEKYTIVFDKIFEMLKKS